MSKTPSSPDDYSPSQTLTTFDNPIPLLRHPTPSLTHSSFTLCFPNPQSWSTAYQSCESNIIQQCSSSARIACSSIASKNCAPPWWKTKPQSKQELLEREVCEVREMEECLERSRIKCRKYAEDKCWHGFRDANIIVEGRGCGDEEVRKCVVGLVSKVWFGGRRVGGVELGRLDGRWSRVRARIGFGVVRGSDLLEKEV